VVVLAVGESGVGKEIVARAVHVRSPRHGQPFVKVNCAALPLDLLESELFGYERGAFTGAHRAKPGKFEIAHTGTIFLDEIGELPLQLQAKLLHVLQDGTFARLGSREDRRVDVRVIAATNKDLERLVAHGAFRADLYYRLNVVTVRVPPLRDRREEIPVLADYFLERYSRHYHRPWVPISPAMVRCFMDYSWPGNIRELENSVKRLVVLGCEDSVRDELLRAARTLSPPVDVAVGGVEPGPAAPVPEVEEEGLKEIARRAARDAERLALERVLTRVHWNRFEAARRLKVNYKTLLAKIREYELDTGKRRRA